MDEVSSYVRLDLQYLDGKAAAKIVPPRLRIPCWKGLGAESEEKREPVSDIDTGVADSLKVLDPDGRLEKRTYDEAAACFTARAILALDGVAQRPVRHKADMPGKLTHVRLPARTGPLEV